MNLREAYFIHVRQNDLSGGSLVAQVFDVGLRLSKCYFVSFFLSE